MKENNDDKPTMIDEIAEWWDYLDLSEKVSVVWLCFFAVAMVTLGILFPIFGIILFIVASVIGTVVALVHLLA